MHRFLSRSDESADLTRRATEGPRKRTLCSTLRRPTERNKDREDDVGAAVENLCIVRAKNFLTDKSSDLKNNECSHSERYTHYNKFRL